MKPWNIQDVIKERVNREANERWANNSENGKIMEIKREKIGRPSLGLYEIFKEFRP